jgi:hypothetical protein
MDDVGAVTNGSSQRFAEQHECIRLVHCITRVFGSKEDDLDNTPWIGGFYHYAPVVRAGVDAVETPQYLSLSLSLSLSLGRADTSGDR